jgi:hypothetical protein
MRRRHVSPGIDHEERQAGDQAGNADEEPGPEHEQQDKQQSRTYDPPLVGQ